jgi:hypothetical protein
VAVIAIVADGPRSSRVTLLSALTRPKDATARSAIINLAAHPDLSGWIRGKVRGKVVG